NPSPIRRAASVTTRVARNQVCARAIGRVYDRIPNPPLPLTIHIYMSRPVDRGAFGQGGQLWRVAALAALTCCLRGRGGHPIGPGVAPRREREPVPVGSPRLRPRGRRNGGSIMYWLMAPAPGRVVSTAVLLLRLVVGAAF